MRPTPPKPHRGGTSVSSADRWAVIGERTWTIDIDAPGTFLADGNTLAQALDNVLENAVSYTMLGDAITFRAHAVGTTLWIDVTDTGLGIPQSALPHVFDRFYRADRARSRSTGGSGLGLAIVRDVVEAHGGSVSIESPPAGGTHLTIELPEYRRGSRAGQVVRGNHTTARS